MVAVRSQLIPPVRSKRRGTRVASAAGCVSHRVAGLVSSRVAVLQIDLWLSTKIVSDTCLLAHPCWAVGVVRFIREGLIWSGSHGMRTSELISRAPTGVER